MTDHQLGENRPLSALEVSDNFVPQYYYIMERSPEVLHQFYRDGSILGWPDAQGAVISVNTINEIIQKVLSMEFGRVETQTVDAQESLGGGVTVLVTGYLTGNNYVKKKFIQFFFLAPQENGFYVLNDLFRFVKEESPGNNYVKNKFIQFFFLAPQENGFYVLNDLFRFVKEESHHQEQQTLSNDAYAPLVVDHDLPSEDVTEEDQTVALLVEDTENGEDVSNLSENEEVEVTTPIVEEDSQPQLVDSDVELVQANVIEEAAQPKVVDSNVEIAQVVPATEVAKDSQQEAVDEKRSYASIVKLMKEKFSESAPARALSKPIYFKTEPQATPPASTSTIAYSSKNQEITEDRYSIYIKNLPLDATPAQLEDAFKKFGPITPDGIQIRSNKLQGFCFGFIQFDVTTAASSAIEASPVPVGGRPAYVEAKRSTGARFMNNRGRFPPGSAFQIDGRGRGNYGGGGRGYGRVNFNTRSGSDHGGRGGGRSGNSQV